MFAKSGHDVAVKRRHQIGRSDSPEFLSVREKCCSRHGLSPSTCVTGGDAPAQC